jgi:hypothetical protein
MQAIEGRERERARTLTAFPREEAVPLDGIVKEAWRALVDDATPPGRLHRSSYEGCLRSALREQGRGTEVGGQGAQRFRNPDEERPHDCGPRREEYAPTVAQPMEAQTVVATGRKPLEAALAAFETAFPQKPQGKILTSKKGQGRLGLSPSDPLPAAPPSTTCRWPW